MWIYLNDAMMEIGQSPGHLTQFRVRARTSGDIERHFPNAVVYTVSEQETRFVAFIDKEEFIKRMIVCMLDIEYTDMLKALGPSLTRKPWYQAVQAVARLAEAAEASVLSKVDANDVAVLEE